MIGPAKIDSKKIRVKEVFEMWFRIPEYQRPYRWTSDQIETLIDDVSYAASASQQGEYFLGSFVFQKKTENSKQNFEFTENELLDGQQRLTSIMLIMAVVRDLTTNPTRKHTCQTYIYQESNPDTKTPERYRLLFDTRDAVRDFLDAFIKQDGGTNDVEKLKEIIKSSTDTSVKNMAQAVITIKDCIKKQSPDFLDKFFPFLLNNVLLIYVSTEDFEDSFQLFTILNDRGLPLSQSDILKAWNLGLLQTDLDKKRYSQFWEDTENEFGENFDRFLSHIRTLLLKDKARLGLLKEFEKRIYGNDNPTGKPLLNKGIDTLKLIEKTKEIYSQLLSANNFSETGDWKFDNLITVMSEGLPSTDWVPPLIKYVEKFGIKDAYQFLVKLDNKVSGDWIAGEVPTTRIENMAKLINLIEKSESPTTVLQSKEFDFDKDSFQIALSSDLYGRKYAKYLLMKLDLIYASYEGPYVVPNVLSIEHVLPQNPAPDSQWCKDCTQEEREFFTNKIGNLVLIGRGKNASLSRLDFKDKVDRYFRNNIGTNPNSLRVFSEYKSWSKEDIDKNHTLSIEKLTNWNLN